MYILDVKLAIFLEGIIFLESYKTWHADRRMAD